MATRSIARWSSARSCRRTTRAAPTNWPWTAYYAAGLTAPADAVDGRYAPDALERWLTGVVARAVEEGQVAAAADPRIEVVSLLAMTNGRVSSVLGQQRSVDDALAVVHYRLDRLFGPP
jgi:hypothetical protein